MSTGTVEPPSGNRGRPADDPPGVEHARYVELASAAVDDEIAIDERAVLDRHLAGCPDCRRFVADADRLRRRCRVRAVDASADPRPVLAVLRRHDRRDLRALARRAGVSGLVAAALVAVVGLSVSTHRTAPPAADEVAVTRTVHAGDGSFDHDRVAVPVGATVEWSNATQHRHLLVQQAGTTTVRTALDPGGQQDVTFHEAGVYEVHCELHPEMAATVTVAS